MLVIMSEATYSSLNDDVVLTQACVLPLINMYKEVNSKDGDLRLFYRQLTARQQILFMFHTYYSHVHKSVEELYWWSAFCMAQETRWRALKEKINELEDRQFTELLKDIEQILHAHNHPVHIEDLLKISREDLEKDTNLGSEFKFAYERFLTISQQTIANIAALIRNSPDQFIQFSTSH